MHPSLGSENRGVPCGPGAEGTRVPAPSPAGATAPTRWAPLPKKSTKCVRAGGPSPLPHTATGCGQGGEAAAPRQAPPASCHPHLGQRSAAGHLRLGGPAQVPRARSASPRLARLGGRRPRPRPGAGPRRSPSPAGAGGAARGAMKAAKSPDAPPRAGQGGSAGAAGLSCRCAPRTFGGPSGNGCSANARRGSRPPSGPGPAPAGRGRKLRARPPRGKHASERASEPRICPRGGGSGPRTGRLA